MKWSEMGAGERDRLIMATMFGHPTGPVLPGEPGLVEGARGGEDAPPYSREVGAAWQVVEHLNNRLLPDGTRVTLAALDYATAARAWHAAFQAASGQAATRNARAWTAGAWATAAADALCQAALLILDYDLDALPKV